LPPGRKPILCYVTGRAAFAGAHSQTGEFTGPSKQILRDRIRGAAAAGVDWIQIREKDLETRDLVELARQAVADTRGTRTRILLNDRLDVALAAAAGGIHLGEKSLPLDAVVQWRRWAGREDFQIGVSRHSLEAACAAGSAGADYVIFGPVFATPSKAAFGAPQGIENLRAVCREIKIPVIAIGGVTLENAGSCMAAGAAGVAAIRLFQESKSVIEVVTRLKSRRDERT